MPKLNMAVIKIINMLKYLFIPGVGSSTCTCVIKYTIYVHNKYSMYYNGTNTFSLTEWNTFTWDCQARIQGGGGHRSPLDK